MENITYQQRAKYAEIIAWCEHMGSYSYYYDLELYRALADDAPSGVISSTDYGNGREWSSVYDMKNKALQAYILRRASEIRTNYANKIAQALGADDIQNTMYNPKALEQA